MKYVHTYILDNGYFISFNLISYEETELEELLLRVMSYGFKVLCKRSLTPLMYGTLMYF